MKGSMLSPSFEQKEDLQFFEKTVEQNGSRLSCNLLCHLTFFNKNNSSPEQRKELREQLIQKIETIKKLSLEQKKSMLTLDVPPQVPFASLSLSHCALMGGFIISPLVHFSLGFDLEKKNRAKEKTVLRISTQDELNQSPSASALWSAKEAVYKSISQYQNHTHIKQISIFDWQPTSSKKEITKIYDYQFKTENTNIKGKGFVCLIANIVVGFAFHCIQ